MGRFDGYDYRIGHPGMTQFVYTGNIFVRTKNKITSRGRADYDIIRKDYPNEITEALLWQDIKVKSSGGSYQEQRITKETKNIQDMQVTYEYFVDDQNVGQTFPSTIDRNKTYSLKVTIKGNNGDSRLTNSVVVMAALADHFGVKDNRVIISNNPTKPVKETVLNKLNTTDFADKLLQELDVKAFEVSKDTVKKIPATVNLSDPSNKWVNDRNVLDKPIGKHHVTIQTQGDPQASIWPQVEVTQNTWSYDDGVNDTSKGEPGYIIIPSGIRLEKQGNKLVGNAYVKFADYNTDKSYTVTVNKTTTMTGVKNPNSKFDLTVNATQAPGEPDKVLITGGLNKNNKEVQFKLQSGSDAISKTNVEDTWNGTLTFYFKQN